MKQKSLLFLKPIGFFCSISSFAEGKIEICVPGGKKMKAYIGEERFILTGKVWEICSMLKQYSKQYIWVTELLKKRV
jgi:hypothetical protein